MMLYREHAAPVKPATVRTSMGYSYERYLIAVDDAIYRMANAATLFGC